MIFGYLSSTEDAICFGLTTEFIWNAGWMFIRNNIQYDHTAASCAGCPIVFLDHTSWERTHPEDPIMPVLCSSTPSSCSHCVLRRNLARRFQQAYPRKDSMDAGIEELQLLDKESISKLTQEISDWSLGTARSMHTKFKSELCDKFVLRNLTKHKYVQQKPTAGISLLEFFLSYASWISPHPFCTNGTGKGPWAEDQFDVKTLNQFVEDVGEQRKWGDVTAEFMEIIQRNSATFKECTGTMQGLR